ncbi:MAG: hypothetical protein NC419_09030 [Muribaculaceae bacterium]|nr:hypothetical protein [Muribaculaceae bacterium]
MKTYLKEETKLVTVHCNCCNKELLVENGILKDECIHISHDFGYFSTRDGETHQFDLCEECYTKIVAKFQIPVETTQRQELL